MSGPSQRTGTHRRPAPVAAAVAAILTATAISGCGSSPGISRGPSDEAVSFRFGASPDSVITEVWEVLRSDGVSPRAFSKSPSDTATSAYLESDWVYIPNVMTSAVFGSLGEPEKWVKFLFWARPDAGGTALFMDALYNPTDLPSEPVNWTRLRPVPSVHPAWSYAERVIGGVERKLSPEAAEEGGDGS